MPNKFTAPELRYEFKHALTESGKAEIVRFSHESGLALINNLTGYEGNIRSSAFGDLNDNKT
jgi:hypothetical protein